MTFKRVLLILCLGTCPPSWGGPADDFFQRFREAAGKASPGTALDVRPQADETYEVVAKSPDGKEVLSFLYRTQTDELLNIKGAHEETAARILEGAFETAENPKLKDKRTLYQMLKFALKEKGVFSMIGGWGLEAPSQVRLRLNPVPDGTVTTFAKEPLGIAELSSKYHGQEVALPTFEFGFSGTDESVFLVAGNTPGIRAGNAVFAAEGVSHTIDVRLRPLDEVPILAASTSLRPFTGDVPQLQKDQLLLAQRALLVLRPDHPVTDLSVYDRPNKKYKPGMPLSPFQKDPCHGEAISKADAALDKIP